MVDPQIIKEWLDKADDDFNFATANLREGSEFFSQICFHFQQAAEKYLKAFIICNGLNFSKVHAVGILPLVYMQSRLFGRFLVSMPFLNVEIDESLIIEAKRSLFTYERNTVR